MIDNWERLYPPVAVDHDWLRHFLAEQAEDVAIERTIDLGGLIHSNYRLQTDRGNCFMRVFGGDPSDAQKEASIQSVLPPGVPASAFLATGECEGYTVVLQEWIEGKTLRAALDQATDGVAESLGYAVGETLGRLNQVDYDEHGFLDQAGQLAAPFSLESEGYQEYFHAALSHAAETVGSELASQCRSYIQRHAVRMDELPDAVHLCHGNLHPDNILVEEVDGHWQVAAIVDWKAALVWLGLLDLAHLLRRPLPQHDALERGLLTGYESRGCIVPDHWPEVQSLLQLLGWVDMLAAGEQRPNVIATARDCIATIVANDDGYTWN